MKKFFTLIACAFVAISALAQETEMKAYIDVQFDRKSNDDAALMAPFKSTEWINDEQVSVVQPRVVKDPESVAADLSDRMANWCVEVISHSNPSNPWDTQFFISLTDRTLSAGDKFKFSMKVKANRETAKGSTQAHTAPGSYKHYEMVGDIPFTTEWADFVYEGTVAGGSDGAYTIAINLNDDAEENVYYFDDIKWEIEAEKVYEWENIYENDGTDLSTVSVKYFKNYTDAAKVVDGAIVVTSLEPDKTYAEYYMEDNDGNAIDAVLANDWDTQFLINLPAPLAAGQKFNLSFKYWADKDAKVGTQAHYAAPAAGAIESKGLGEYPEYAGTYLFYQLAGDLSFTTEAQTFEKTVTVPDNANGMQAVCFNLEGLREVNNYYFDDIAVAFEKDDVPTAINSFKAEKVAKTIYNVAGQQIKSLQKGLNIVNGEKVYVK